MATADRSISSVLHDIVGNVQDIVRSELRLARTELTEDLAKARKGAVLLGIGTLLLWFSALFVLVAVVYALSLVMAGWAAAAIVALAVGAIASLCMSIGIRRLKSMRAVPKTTETLKENAEWARQLTRS
jgi:uncharacterized membrane protein YqjE